MTFLILLAVARILVWKLQNILKGIFFYFQSGFLSIKLHKESIVKNGKASISLQ